MASLFSFFSRREEEQTTPGGEEQRSRAPVAEGVRWRSGHFQGYPVGQHLQAVRTPLGLPTVLPSFAVEFAYSCTEFRSLREHIGSYAEKHGWDSLQVQALEAALPALAEAGALISTEKIREHFLDSATHGQPAPVIGSIGFPTGGKRLHFLERALRSFAENLQAHGRTARFLIADSSADAADAEAFRKLGGDLGRELKLEVLYAGEPEKRRFVEALVGMGACTRASAEFALLDPLGIRFACGANRNAILLQGAGEPVCSVDDDVVCRLARPPASAGQFELTCFSNRDPYSRWQFPDRETTWQSADWAAHDFLAAHEALLGRAGAELFQAGLEQIDFELLNDDFLRRMHEPATRVRATFTGHVGDPGIPTSTYFLFFDRENRERLTASEAHYRAAFSSRSVLTTFHNAAIGDASVSPGMAMGLDHRELLPPFFPVLHAEDYIWGATLWQSCPDAWLGHVPLAIQHDTGPGKPILLPSELNRERRAVIFEWAHLLRRFVLRYRVPMGATASACLTGLGSYLQDLAKVPEREFDDFLATEVLAHESEKLSWLEKQLDEAEDMPEFWQRDVRRYLEHVRDALTFEDFDIPFDLKPRGTPEANRRLMQRMVREFGGLLQDWPAMVDAAKQLRESGQALMVPCDRC